MTQWLIAVTYKHGGTGTAGQTVLMGVGSDIAATSAAAQTYASNFVVSKVAGIDGIAPTNVATLLSSTRAV